MFDENGNVIPSPIPASVVLGQSVESEHPVLSGLKTRIAELEREVEVTKGNSDNYRNRWNTLVNQRYTLENALRTFVEDEELSMDIAGQIAEIFDITLTKTIDVELTYKVSVSVEVPLGSELTVDDVADYVSISVDYSGEGDLIESDSDLDDWNERS
jgi:hypothetical protein